MIHKLYPQLNRFQYGADHPFAVEGFLTPLDIGIIKVHSEGLETEHKAGYDDGYELLFGLMSYTDPVEKFSGDLMEVLEYLDACASGSFMDYDGFGLAVKNGMISHDIYVAPSKPHRIPPDATHVMWFNR